MNILAVYENFGCSDGTMIGQKYIIHCLSDMLHLWLQFSKKLGYSNIDGVDASLSMLENAAKKSVYQRLYCAMLGDGRKLPMIDGRQIFFFLRYGWSSCNHENSFSFQILMMLLWCLEFLFKVTWSSMPYWTSSVWSDQVSQIMKDLSLSYLAK